MPRLFPLLAVLALACSGPPGVRLAGDALEPWQARAERARGLSLEAPVPARLVPREALPALLERELLAVAPPEELASLEWAGRAVGLLPPDADLRRALLEFASEGLEGFYSPRIQALFVVGTPRGGTLRGLLGGARPELRDPTVLVHELAHALQSSHSVLDEATLGLWGHDDLAFALGALLEGDALWTAFRDLELERGTPPPEPAAFAREMALAWAEADPDVPRAVREPLVLQYPLGYGLVRRLAAEGGTSRLDAALADPPLSSEQLLHPERYGDPAQAPRFLELPPAAPPGCALRHANTLGELGLRIWLAERRGPGSAVARPADGWDGDRLAVYDCGGTAAFAWVMLLADAAEARELEVVAGDAVRGLATGLAGPARVDARGRVVLVSAGLDAASRERLLTDTVSRRYADLEAFLEAHPAVLERARRLRAGGR